MKHNLPMWFPSDRQPLCANGIIMGDGDLYLDGQGMSPASIEKAVSRPRVAAPGLTTLVPLTDRILTSERLRLYLDRYPVQSLDRSVVVLPPESVGDQSLEELGEWADRLGLPVRFPVRALDTTAGGDLPLAEHRVLDLDAAGTQVAPGAGEWVQVLPRSTRAALAHLLRNKSHRLVLSPDGVQLGMPPAQVGHLFGDVLPGSGEAQASPVGDAFAATGTTPAVADGYAFLAYALRELPAGGQALVVADRPFQLVRHADTGNLAVIDVAAAAPGLLPLEPAAIHYAELPADISPAKLQEILYGVRPDEQELFQWRTADGGAFSVEVVGPRTGIDRHLAMLAELAQELDQPMIVAGVERPGAAVTEKVLTRLDERLEVYGWAGEVPLVVTLGDIAGLLGKLTERNAAVLHQTPGLTTGGSLVNLGPPPWAMREPGKEQPVAVRDELSADLIRDGGGVHRRPPFPRPSLAVGTFLTTSLTEPETVRATVGRLGADLRTGLGQVAEISARVPMFEGHQAVLNLADAGRLDATLDYLGDRRRPGAILGPLLTAAPAQVPALLPQLAALAGKGLDDVVSQQITQSLSDLIAGTADAAQVTARIHQLGPKLPTEGGIRAEWVTELHRLSPLLSGNPEVVPQVMEAVMTCPG